MRDFTRQSKSDLGRGTNWEIGAKAILYSASGYNTQSSQRSWAILPSDSFFLTPGQVTTLQLLAIPSTVVSGVPARRVLIERLGGCGPSQYDIQSGEPSTSVGRGVSAASQASSAGSVGVVGQSSAAPLSQLVAQGGMGTIGTATSLGVVCPPNMTNHAADEIFGFMTCLYVANEIFVGGVANWTTKDPVNILVDARYGDYLHLRVDAYVGLAYCGLGQPFSSWKHDIRLPEPIIIGSGQALHLGIACLGTNSHLDQFQVTPYVRLLTTLLE